MTSRFTPDDDSDYPMSPVAQILLRDADGKVWSITVRPDGQLQTAKYPDGEPMTTTQHLGLEFRREFPAAFRKAMNDMSPGFYPEPGIEGADQAG